MQVNEEKDFLNFLQGNLKQLKNANAKLKKARNHSIMSRGNSKNQIPRGGIPRRSLASKETHKDKLAAFNSARPYSQRRRNNRGSYNPDLRKVAAQPMRRSFNRVPKLPKASGPITPRQPSSIKNKNLIMIEDRMSTLRTDRAQMSPAEELTQRQENINNMEIKIQKLKDRFGNRKSSLRNIRASR
jgi:hypothetical protein